MYWAATVVYIEPCVVNRLHRQRYIIYQHLDMSVLGTNLPRLAPKGIKLVIIIIFFFFTKAQFSLHFLSAFWVPFGATVAQFRSEYGIPVIVKGEQLARKVHNTNNTRETKGHE